MYVYTLIPVKDAILMIQKLFFDFQTVTPNGSGVQNNQMNEGPVRPWISRLVLQNWISLKACASADINTEKSLCWKDTRFRIFNYKIQENLEKSLCWKTDCGRLQLVLFTGINFCWDFYQEFYSKFNSILADSVSAIIISGKIKVIENCFLFTIDLKTLYMYIYTLIPVEDAILRFRVRKQ